MTLTNATSGVSSNSAGKEGGAVAVTTSTSTSTTSGAAAEAAAAAVASMSLGEGGSAISSASQGLLPTPSLPASTVAVSASGAVETGEVYEGAGISSEGKMDSLHPLEHEWTFWFDKAQNRGPRPPPGTGTAPPAYESNLASVGTFKCVEDFWRFYNHIAKPSGMEPFSNYHLFKTGVKPMWEDPANSKGGKWTMIFRNNHALLDFCWEELLLSMIGEVLDGQDEVCGAVVSRRKAGDRIAIWNRSAEDLEAVRRLGMRIKDVLGKRFADSRITLDYSAHGDSIKHGMSFVKAHLTL